MCLVLSAKMLPFNSVHMITFIDFGRDVLNSIFARKVPFFSVRDAIHDREWETC